MKTKIRNGSINSKDIKKNDLFFAIKGKNKDGNKFVKEALNKGASLAIVNKINSKKNFSKQIKVKNSLDLLTKMSKISRGKAPSISNQRIVARETSSKQQQQPLRPQSNIARYFGIRKPQEQEFLCALNNLSNLFRIAQRDGASAVALLGCGNPKSAQHQTRPCAVVH